MFSKNVLLFVATSIAMAAGPASGSVPSLHLKATAVRDISKLESLSEDNIRFEAPAGRTNLVAGCVAAKELSRGEALEPRDLICASEALELPRDRVSPNLM